MEHGRCIYCGNPIENWNEDGLCNECLKGLDYNHEVKSVVFIAIIMIVIIITSVFVSVL